jgi:hypothetical protein
LGAPSSAYAIPIESDPKMKWQVRRSLNSTFRKYFSLDR